MDESIYSCQCPQTVRASVLVQNIVGGTEGQGQEVVSSQGRAEKTVPSEASNGKCINVRWESTAPLRGHRRSQ